MDDSVISDVMEILELIKTELYKTRIKHPDPEWPVNPIQASMLLREEVDGLVQVANKFYYQGGDDIRQDMMKEAVCCGAMAIRFLLNAWVYKSNPLLSFQPVTRFSYLNHLHKTNPLQPDIDGNWVLFVDYQKLLNELHKIKPCIPVSITCYEPFYDVSISHEQNGMRPALCGHYVKYSDYLRLFQNEFMAVSK